MFLLVSTVTITSRYIGTKMGCPCGLARRIKFSDLLKQFDESKLDETESVMFGVDLEAHPLMLDRDFRKDQEVVPLETESSISVSDMVSHETVDSQGQLVKIKIQRDLASMVDIIKHKAAKRLRARNMFKSLA